MCCSPSKAPALLRSLELFFGTDDGPQPCAPRAGSVEEQLSCVEGGGEGRSEIVGKREEGRKSESRPYESRAASDDE